MTTFMNQDFLLNTPTARHLYHDFARQLPIIDYHCHIPAAEIAQDIHFQNITSVWLNADHYKWRFMRTCGITEDYITGNRTDKEKFSAYAKCIGLAVGNPLFSWSHLELQRYFSYNGILCEKTAETVWEHCNRILSSPSMSARSIMLASHVHTICTTDDPADSLKYHIQIKEDPSFSIQVLPSFRPDLSLEIGKPDYLSYLQKLSCRAELAITDLASLKAALHRRLEAFVSCGCRVTDHGLTYVPYAPCTDEEAADIFLKRCHGESITIQEEREFKTNLLAYLAGLYHKHDLVMQLHFGCKRDNNTLMYQAIGPNTGYDCIASQIPSDELADFLNLLAANNILPKTILYSLNPNDNQMLGTLIGCFQDGKTAGKIQQGVAWWFNDNKTEIEKQLVSFANLSNLSGFVGMLTDSRSFLSYTRHEYFRRILCNLLGNLVENGEYPADDSLLSEIVSNICYRNALHYFRL